MDSLSKELSELSCDHSPELTLYRVMAILISLPELMTIKHLILTRRFSHNCWYVIIAKIVFGGGRFFDLDFTINTIDRFETELA